MQQSVVILGIVLGTFLSGCFWEKEVARVGQYAITEKDAKYRDRVARLFYPNSPADVGVIQLIQAYTDAQILTQNGHEIDEKTLDQEEARIDANTKDPKMLTRVKEIFGADKQAYRKVFVLPTYAQRTLYFDFFLNSSKVQESTRAPAVEFFQRAQVRPHDFAKVAKESKYSVKSLTISAEEGIVWGSEKKKNPQAPNQPSTVPVQFQQQLNPDAKAEASRWLAELVVPTKPGSLVSNIVDAREQWIVLHYLGYNSAKKVYKLEGVFFPKQDYSKWYEAEKAKFKIERY